MSSLMNPNSPGRANADRGCSPHLLRAILSGVLPVLLISALPGAAEERTSENDPQFARWLKKFPKADANGDGILTASEVKAYREMMRRDRGAKDRGKRGGLAAKLPPDVENEKYGPHERNVLDLWKAKSDKPTPVVTYFHGGGFVGGDKRTANPALAEACLASGISFAAANYRFVTADPFPAPMHDGARVIQFLRHKAKDWNIDPARIAAYGGSAGAGMSLWLAFHEDLADPDSEDPVAQRSSRLACAGSIGGQSSYDPHVIKEWIGGRAHEHASLCPFYGIETIEEINKPELQKLFDEASAIKHLTKDDPPVFMFYSEANRALPENARPGQGIHHPIFGLRLKEKMDELGIEAVYRHRSDGANLTTELPSFLKKHLQPGATEEK